MLLPVVSFLQQNMVTCVVIVFIEVSRFIIIKTYVTIWT